MIQNGFPVKIQKKLSKLLLRRQFCFRFNESLTLLGIAVGLVEYFIAERFLMSIARGRSYGTVLIEVTRRKKRAGWKI
jgi:hypothetical protein